MRRLMVQDMDGDDEREHDNEVEDEDAYERFGSGLSRVGFVGMALVLVQVLVRPVWEVCMDCMRPGEFGKNLKGMGE